MEDKYLSPAKRALLEKWLQGQLKEDTISISRRPLNSQVPLSFPQQRQLFLELLEPGTAVNNLSVFLKFEGRLDVKALEQSTNKIIARHDALRTRFSFGNGLPVPEILTDKKVTVPIVDLQQFDINAQMNEAVRLAEKEVLKTFDLTSAPLLRIKLYLLNKEKYLLLLVVHHAIADGWSLGVFLRELMMFYNAITGNRSIHLPELPIQYPDFAYWQTNVLLGEASQSSMSYWKKQLAGEIPVLELPTDHQRGSRQTFSGGKHRFVVSPQLVQAIDKLCRQEDVTLFMALLTTFIMLLHRYSGQDEILVGTPIANRNRQELENLIGVFINTLVLRTKIPDEVSFRELLKQVRDISLDAYAHQDLPFEKLVEELKPQRDLSRTPLFQAVFNMQNAPMPELRIQGLDIGFIDIDRGVSQFDITLMMSLSDGEWVGTVEYNRDLFRPATIDRMFQSFRMLLENAIIQPDLPVSKLQLMTTEEQHCIVNELNRTRLDFPGKICIHQLFETQVEKTPDAIAVIHDDIRMTYLELNCRANLLAKHLQSLGVGHGIR
ncbi:MAG: non-ribosomal peptide synthetase, partial [Chitinophagaceae bacterium]